MHDAPPAGQLRGVPPHEPSAAEDYADNGLCTQCHAAHRGPAAAARHGRHRVGSVGNRCVACHMPRVVYGLVRAHRSHRIERPRGGAGSPSPCGLCHVQAGPPELAVLWERAGFEVPEGLAKASTTDVLFAGDPIERAVAADALGRVETDSTGVSVGLRFGLLLAVLAEDPYPAVRQIAYRALCALGERHAPQWRAQLRPELVMMEPERRRVGVSDAEQALPAGYRVTLDEVSMARLRRSAEAVAIEIGE